MTGWHLLVCLFTLVFGSLSYPSVGGLVRSVKCASTSRQSIGRQYHPSAASRQSPQQVPPSPRPPTYYRSESLRRHIPWEALTFVNLRLYASNRRGASHRTCEPPAVSVSKPCNIIDTEPLSSCVSAVAYNSKSFLSRMNVTVQRANLSGVSPPQADTVSTKPNGGSNDTPAPRKGSPSGKRRVITVTPNAMDHFIELRDKRLSKSRRVPPGDGAGDSLTANQHSGRDPTAFRIGVKTGGCSGLSYTLDYLEDDEVEGLPMDAIAKQGQGRGDHVERFDSEDLIFLIDPKALLYIIGMELDYTDDLIGGGFRFTNPNASRSCSCGLSFGVPKSLVSPTLPSVPKRCS